MKRIKIYKFGVRTNMSKMATAITMRQKVKEVRECGAMSWSRGKGHAQWRRLGHVAESRCITFHCCNEILLGVCYRYARRESGVHFDNIFIGSRIKVVNKAMQCVPDFNLNVQKNCYRHCLYNT